MVASLSIRPNWQFKFRFFHSEFYGKNPFDVGCMSTMEAVASCIRVLESNGESEISSEEVEVLRAVLLAHSTQPMFGDLHFNREKSWSFEGGVYDMETVALHEIGHLLGLDHSPDENAVMYEKVSRRKVKRVLTQDDIDGINDLYKPE